MTCCGASKVQWLQVFHVYCMSSIRTMSSYQLGSLSLVMVVEGSHTCIRLTLPHAMACAAEVLDQVDETSFDYVFTDVGDPRACLTLATSSSSSWLGSRKAHFTSPLAHALGGPHITLHKVPTFCDSYNPHHLLQRTA